MRHAPGPGQRLLAVTHSPRRGVTNSRIFAPMRHYRLLPVAALAALSLRAVACSSSDSSDGAASPGAGGVAGVAGATAAGAAGANAGGAAAGAGGVAVALAKSACDGKNIVTEYKDATGTKQTKTHTCPSPLACEAVPGTHALRCHSPMSSSIDTFRSCEVPADCVGVARCNANKLEVYGQPTCVEGECHWATMNAVSCPSATFCQMGAETCLGQGPSTSGAAPPPGPSMAFCDGNMFVYMTASGGSGSGAATVTPHVVACAGACATSAGGDLSCEGVPGGNPGRTCKTADTCAGLTRCLLDDPTKQVNLNGTCEMYAGACTFTDGAIVDCPSGQTCKTDHCAP